MAESNNTYEAMFLYGPTAAQDLDGALQQCRSIVERHGGEVLVIKKWDERKLAYEIGGQKRGTYIICYYRGPGSSVTAIERDVNLSEQILRVMLTRADHLNQKEMEAVEPQPIIREERPSWDRPMGDDRFRRDDRGPRQPRRDEAPAAEPAGAEKE